jgi:1-deoxy-D-xylulose-5-phosphate synthase
VVELTIALHRVFDSPQDKIIWDVGHQCYAHKLLTGRYAAFSGLRRRGGLAGFPKRSESPHDIFNTGHASTSISAALGFLAAEAKLGAAGRKKRVAAVIGDGALSGGLAFEALSHAGQLKLPLVVILNDNKMSIGPNVGGLSRYLSRLSMKSKYQLFQRTFDAMVRKIPFFGEDLFEAIRRLKRAVKAVFYVDNFFVDLGFEYVGPIDGHNIQLLSDTIRDAANLGKPVIVHVITRKGKGYGFAEDDPGMYHGVSSFSAGRGLAKDADTPASLGAGFTDVFAASILSAAEKDKRITAISAAMEQGTGLAPFKKAFPGRFFDVGIAEAHQITFAAGMAAGGLKPVAAVYSTFSQRAADQIIHDVCLQNLPVVFALDHSGFVSDDGETHQGLFDISLFRSAPNINILAPAGKEEMIQMLDWALALDSPVMLRYPKAFCPSGDAAFSLPLEKGRGVFIKRGKEAAALICFCGGLYAQALAAADILSQEGIEADQYNLRFIKPADEDYLAGLMNRYRLTVFAEEGMKAGGFGEYAAELAFRRKCSAKVLVLGVNENFASLGKREELLHDNGLDGEGIALSILKALREAEAAL